MTDIARKVSMAADSDYIDYAEGAQQISRILRERSAPGAIDAIYPNVVKFVNFNRTDQTMNVYSIEFDVLRDKADGKMVMGNGFKDEFVSIFCMQNTPLSENGKSLALARIQRTPAFPLATKQMRRLLGPRRMHVEI